MVRWLHISDVHECDKENYHRKAMYDEIIAAAQERNPKPHLVFITGDLAFSGIKDEYKSFRTRLFDPLKAALPDGCPIFMVPGNHDVDRNAVTKPRNWIEDREDLKAFQAVSSVGLRKRSDMLLPRFSAYRKLEQSVSSWKTDWLASEQGSVCQIETVDGAKIALVGINTAWLCQDKEDWGKLTAGKDMVDAALREAKAKNPDVVIVLGHHPLDAMTGELAWSDGQRIRRRLEQANALYLHGHLHTAGQTRTGGSLQSTLAIQAPSAFQAGERRSQMAQWNHVG